MFRSWNPAIRETLEISKRPIIREFKTSIFTSMDIIFKLKTSTLYTKQ